MTRDLLIPKHCHLGAWSKTGFLAFDSKSGGLEIEHAYCWIGQKLNSVFESQALRLISMDGDLSPSKYDWEWHDMARQIKAMGKPVFFRLAAEMNGDWNPWGNNPEAYINMWRYVHDIFWAGGATNAVWVFCPISWDADQPHHWTEYYPGDSYVDWLGVDGFNNGHCKSPTGRWNSPKAIFEPWLVEAESLYPLKPIMVAEWGCAPGFGIHTKADWLKSAHTYFKTKSQVKALVYFNEKKECNWLIDSGDPLTAWRSIAADTYYQG